MCSKSSCLGEPWCSDWRCCDTDPGSQPAAKRTGVDGERLQEGRFTAPHSPTTMSKICQGYITTKSISWAVRVFRSWCDERNKRVEEQCPETLLEEPTVDNLNYWLSRFVVEVSREDGKPYPPTSINNILAGLYRYAKSCLPTGVVCPEQEGSFISRFNWGYSSAHRRRWCSS